MVSDNNPQEKIAQMGGLSLNHKLSENLVLETLRRIEQKLSEPSLTEGISNDTGRCSRYVHACDKKITV